MVSSTLNPVGRTLAEFKPLKPAEQMLLEACRKGEYASISEQRPEQATEENMVRASFLRFLALGGDEQVLVHEKGVRLCGAWIEGELDLEGAILPRSLMFVKCHLSTIILRDSNVLGFVNFNGCYVEGLEADGMVCSGSLSLEGSFITTVYLSGAEISGNLDCTGGKFDGADDALLCESTVIKGNVFLNNATATSTVRLVNAQIGGSLECTNAKFNDLRSDDQHVGALACDRAVIKGGVFLNNGFTATGTVRFSNAQIDSDLTCIGGKFDGTDGGDALLCQSTVIKGNVFLNNATAIGTVRLVGAQIGGSLECTNAKFNDLRSDDQHVGALACDRAVIKGGVFLNTGFTATGTVSLSSAQIGGNLDCTEATFNGGDGGYALLAEGLVVAGGFFFRDLSSANGIVSLASAQISSLVDDDQSWFKVELILDGFIYDRLTGEAPMNAKSRLAWLAKQSDLHLGRGNNGSDFKPQPWRQLQKVLHDMGHVEDARQVAIAFEDRLRAANLIGQTSKKWSKSRAWTYQKICRGFHRLFGWLIGYGYRPLRLFFKMVVVWLACGLFYWEVALYANNGNGVFAPSNPLVFQNSDYDVCKADKDASKFELHELDCRLPSTQGAGNWYLCEKLREEYTGFSPFLYSLDLILPLVDLQQEHDWAPMIPTPQNTWANELSNLINLKHWTRLVMWFEILFGWMSSLLLAAVVSGLTKRREE